MSDSDYAAVHPLIVNAVCTNYHQQYSDGTTIALDPQGDFMITDFKLMRDLFIAILRRAGGNNIMEVTEDTRQKILVEFARVSWQKNKPPEMATWYTFLSFSFFSLHDINRFGVHFLRFPPLPG